MRKQTQKRAKQKRNIKKISTFTAPLTSTTWGSPVAQVWNVNWVQTATNIGVTEPTSSGSPLFQANRLIVGQLFGGPSACGIAANFRNDNYGRVNSSWAGEGANTNRLSNWLDPNNSGANTLAGGFWDGCLQNITVSNPINTFADIQAANSITANSIIANGATVNMRTGNFIEFTNGFDSRTGSTLTAQIAPCGGRVIPPANKQENEEIAKNSINSNSNAIHVYPNPSAGKLNIDFALTESDQVSFSVTNLLGEVVLSWNKNYSVGGNISEQTTLENLASGVYLVNVSNKKINFNQKIVVQ